VCLCTPINQSISPIYALVVVGVVRAVGVVVDVGAVVSVVIVIVIVVMFK